jgi:hypothetical protein
MKNEKNTIEKNTIEKYPKRDVFIQKGMLIFIFILLISILFSWFVLQYDWKVFIGIIILVKLLRMIRSKMNV